MQGKWWEFAKAYEDSKAWQCWAGHGAAVRREMDRAQRFFLPAGVDLSVGKRYEDVGDLLRLPFDTVAVMSETDTNEDWGTNRREALHTITLAVSAEAPDSPAFGYMPADRWPPGHTPWLLLIPLARAPHPAVWVPGGPATAVTKTESGGGLALNMVPVLTPFTSDLLRTGLTAAQLTNEVRDDLKCVVELCLLLGLQNVRSILQPAPKGAAKARARKGKQPLFDYHVLEVDGERWEERAAVELATGRGVRSHLRRGHIRRLSESRRVWVRACYVHGAEPGFAAKDYALST
jgi:hypothetical protein